MRTLEQVAKLYKSKCLDGRDLGRLFGFIPWDMVKEFGYDPEEVSNVPKEKWEADLKPWTREAILEQLEKDVAFGFEKALDRRGISAGLMFEVVRMWNWILEDGLEDWPDYNYAMYGLPLFKATALKYGFDNPIGHDNGDEAKYGDEDYD